jgi:hypothetical protein
MSHALTSSFDSHAQQQQQIPTIDQSGESVSFSLDDITDDVDHIQSSLDNIRDFMFDNLPDGTSIDDLFDEDHQLLSPLLNATELSDHTSKAIVDNVHNEKIQTSGKNAYVEIQLNIS